MIPTILIGRGGSTGLPNKNLREIVGRPLMEYPILATQNAALVDSDRLYLSTDSEPMKEFGRKLGMPDHRATQLPSH